MDSAEAEASAEVAEAASVVDTVEALAALIIMALTDQEALISAADGSTVPIIDEDTTATEADVSVDFSDSYYSPLSYSFSLSRSCSAR